MWFLFLWQSFHSRTILFFFQFTWLCLVCGVCGCILSHYRRAPCTQARTIQHLRIRHSVSQRAFPYILFRRCRRWPDLAWDHQWNSACSLSFPRYLSLCGDNPPGWGNWPSFATSYYLSVATHVCKLKHFESAMLHPWDCPDAASHCHGASAA